MGGSSKSQTVGYRYYMGAHKVLCHGPVDYFLQIKVDGRIAWQGRTPQGPIVINRENLFGGESREGGISGTLDLMSGSSTQGINSYLAARLGSYVTAFRGVAGVVLRQMYIGLNPYPKKWSFRLKRIHTRQDGIPQWYDTRAEVNGDSFSADPDEYSTQYGGTTLTTVDSSGSVWIAAGGLSSLIRSVDGGNTWTSVAGGGSSTNHEIVTNGEGTWIGPTSGFGQIRRSVDNGESFGVSTISSIEIGNVRLSCAGYGNDVFMVGGNYAGTGYISVSFDNGNNWSAIPGIGEQNRLGAYSVQSVAHYSGNTWYASDAHGDVWKSNTAGGFWSLDGQTNIKKLVKLDLGLFAITQANQVLRLSSSGSWISSTSVGFSPNDLCTLGNLIIAVGDGGRIALSYNAGMDWDLLPQVLAGGTTLNSISSDGENTAYAVGQGGVVARIKIIPEMRGDMNAAHIIRECLTDPDWGMGYPETELDENSFIEAANLFYYEGMGLSLLWSKQATLEDFISDVLRHIDGSLYVDRKTGLFTLALIRNDYDEDLIPVLDESNVERVDNFNRPSLGEVPNSVTVKYWNVVTGNDASVTVQDIALIQMQNSVINTTLQYPGITDSKLAARVAQRDLKALSMSKASGSLYATRSAADQLNIGKVFKFYWPDYEVDGVVMRVTGMAYGDGVSNKVKIQFTQDVFDTPDISYVVPSDPEWTDPIQEPGPIEYQAAFELPYLELVQTLSQSSVDVNLEAMPEMGFVGSAAARPSTGGNIQARMYVSTGEGFSDVSTVDFSPSTSLTGSVDKFETVFPIGAWRDVEILELGTWGQIGEELVYLESVGVNTITVKRAVLDTIPSEHPAGTPILFWDQFSGTDTTEYVEGESVLVRLTSSSGSGQTEVEDSTELVVNLSARAIRPYRPGNFRGNGQYFFDSQDDISWPLSLEWFHRNRRQETSGELLGYYDAGITSENGVTYTIRVLAMDGVGGVIETLHTESGITNDYWDMDESIILGSDAAFFKVTINSVRDGFESWTTPSIILPGYLVAPTGLTASAENY